LISAIRAEKQIANNLHEELQVALRSVDSDPELSALRLASLGGVLLGCGFLFLFTPLGQSSLRRCGVCLPFGRRASDQALGTTRVRPVSGGRRGTDPSPPSDGQANSAPPMSNVGIAASVAPVDGWSQSATQYASPHHYTISCSQRRSYFQRKRVRSEQGTLHENHRTGTQIMPRGKQHLAVRMIPVRGTCSGPK